MNYSIMEGGLKYTIGYAHPNIGGYKEYKHNNKVHRILGPAIIYPNGDQMWYQEGNLHRMDGPAVKISTGGEGWYFKGNFIECSSQHEFEQYLKLKAFW